MDADKGWMPTDRRGKMGNRLKADFHSVEKVARSIFCDHFLLKYKIKRNG
jgi:hypothetical protein